MLLTITTTHTPATDLGYLLHKHPDRVQTFDLSFGQAHVVWPEAGPERATMALLLDVDPVALVRGSERSQEGGPLDQYVNDRPYVASSFLSVALSRVFGSALNGTCAQRPALVEQPLPLEIGVEVLPARGHSGLIERLFDPLGYAVEAERLPRDEENPAWGASALYRVRLRHTLPLSAALRHLYVLLPVLDGGKHYWVAGDEVEKLLTKGEGWLAGHPEQRLISFRYLKKQRSLAQEALARLADEAEIETAEEEAPAPAAAPEEAMERPLSLDKQRRQAVLEALAGDNRASVVDLGCGEGKLLVALLEDRRWERVLGVDVSLRALEIAERRLHLDRRPMHWGRRLTLIQGSLTYRDARLEGFDAAAVVEVVEHLDPGRLSAFERALFGCARPARVVLTTPNREHNVLFTGLPPGELRHPDHRFEWTRAEFAAWAGRVAEEHGYSVTFSEIGVAHPEHGAPTQMGVFDRCA
ncbi:MAG: 3' terminal RNA ribose 2'-O-methyltransferase Hen1 [Pseudomonadota bacterium]